MPRPERPLDPADGPVSDFAAQLRELRQAAGNPGYRRLAQRAHYSAATLAAAASGRRLPSLEVTLAIRDGKLSDGGADGGSCLTVLMTPGGHPLAELADQLAALAGAAAEPTRDEGFEPLVERVLAGAPQAQLVLVVDQFEEIFTLCT